MPAPSQRLALLAEFVVAHDADGPSSTDRVETLMTLVPLAGAPEPLSATSARPR